MEKYTLLAALKGRPNRSRVSDNRCSNRALRRNSKVICNSLKKSSSYTEETLDRYEEKFLKKRHSVFGCDCCPRRRTGVQRYELLDHVLHGSEGRPWNEVYSRLCGVLDKRSKKQRVILNRIKNKISNRTGIFREEDVSTNEFYIDMEGFLRLKRPVSSELPKRLKPPCEQDIQKFVGTREVAIYDAYRNEYNKKKAYTRRVVQAGSKLFWAYPTHPPHNSSLGLHDNFKPKEELSKDEYKFFNRLSTWQKKIIIYKKHETTGQRYSNSGKKYNVEKWLALSDEVVNVNRKSAFIKDIIGDRVIYSGKEINRLYQQKLDRLLRERLERLRNDRFFS